MAEKMATRAAYGKALVEIGAENPNLVVMDADLSKSTMTNEFSKTYPERFFNMGIAEQNLYGTAAGLALSGKVVCASTFAMFASGRAFEIIRNSIGYTGRQCKDLRHSRGHHRRRGRRQPSDLRGSGADEDHSGHDRGQPF